MVTTPIVRAASLACLVLLGCDPVHVGPSTEVAPDEPPVAPASDEPGDTPCAELTRDGCRRSLVCTLAVDGARSNRYVCRPAEGNCEVGLTQSPDARDRCDDREGCAWREDSCYCDCRGAGQTAVPDGAELDDCDCECGGGPPMRCEALETTTR